MLIEVRRAGLLTTVQDRGREGWRRFGVPRSGALDLEEAMQANALVGNDAGDAVLEATMDGPTLGFPDGGLIALGGADASCLVNGVDVPTRHPIALERGSIVAVGRAVDGSRIYVAVAGGIDVPILLGSRSTCLRAQFGGYEGRALRSGDVLQIGTLSERSVAVVRELTRVRSLGPTVGHWRAQRRIRNRVVQFLRGEDYPLLAIESRRALTNDAFIVDSASDRMGLRLRGRRMRLVHDLSLPSRAVFPGTIQLPPDGMPIILLADSGTTGGYPVIGYVTRANLSGLGQLRVGEEVRLKDEGSRIKDEG